MTQPYSIVSGTYLGSSHPDFELEGSARSVVQFEGILPEAAPCVAYAPISYICDSMSKRYCRKGVVSRTYVSFVLADYFPNLTS